jgi:hypothetical protein
MFLSTTRPWRQELDRHQGRKRQRVPAHIVKQKTVWHYFWINKEAGETNAREMVVAFHHLKEWNGVIAAGSYMDE